MRDKWEACPQCGAYSKSEGFDYDGQRCPCGWPALDPRPTPTDTAPDRNVEAVRDKYLQRSQTGVEKYGVTTEREDLTLRRWLIHFQEELMDATVYVERIIADLDKAPSDSQPDPRLLRLLHEYTAEAELFLENHTIPDSDFLDHQDKAEYQRMCALIDDAREALGLPTQLKGGHD